WAMKVNGPCASVFGSATATPTMWKSSIIIGGKAMMPIHPGRLLRRELATRGLSANRLALALRVPSGRITAILNGKRAITPETALRLGRYFGNSGQFWMTLQTRYDLAIAEQKLGRRIENEVQSAA